ncbi:MAG: ChbG/HpnK family deacetylase [Deltaproteobacteria bacterium]|nr:ChbG/HpnK family deacetylase [Deltaproteobacteria bacterium]
MPMSPGTGARLVVNADDYGYFSCVSRGILEAARAGRVTAVGALANSPRFAERARALGELPDVDAGVHLTLTFGEPLTGRMAAALRPWSGRFPRNKAEAAWAVLRGRIPSEAVEEEWAAQVRRCLEAGLTVRFLNSHEHVHVLPPLARALRRLAATFGIPHVRAPAPEWGEGGGAPALLRNLAFQAAQWLAPRTVGGSFAPLPLLGVAESGRLTLGSLDRRLAALEPDRTYELMCHPGHFDPAEIRDPRLLSYHRWEAELSLLTGAAFGELCARRGVRLARYRDLDAPAAPAPPAETR